MAGTFTLVGLVGTGILIWAIIYLIRRRRATKYDRESEEAAAEAATAPVPVFLDDEDESDHSRNSQIALRKKLDHLEKASNLLSIHLPLLIYVSM